MISCFQMAEIQCPYAVLISNICRMIIWFLTAVSENCLLRYQCPYTVLQFNILVPYVPPPEHSLTKYQILQYIISKMIPHLGVDMSKRAKHSIQRCRGGTSTMESDHQLLKSNRESCTFVHILPPGH